MDPDKKKKILTKLITELNQSGLTDKEIVEVYSDLGLSVGCSMCDLKEVPAMEEIEEMYYKSPNMGLALVLQSILLRTWIDE